MEASRKMAIIVGRLFIIATGATVLSSVFTGPYLEASNYVIQVSANETQMVIGLLFMLVTAIAVVSIAVMMYRSSPIVHRGRSRKRSFSAQDGSNLQRRRR